MDDMITTERVGIVAHRLALGEAGTTMEIAAWIGLSRQSTWKMLDKLSRVLPIVFINGRWCSLHGCTHLLQCDIKERTGLLSGG